MKFITLRLRSVALVGALLCALGAGMVTANAAGAEEVYWSGARALPIYSVQRDDNKVALSFDCAWGVDYTDSLLQTLEAQKVHVTFFMVQFWAEKYPEYVKKIAEAGHEIGTHSATHSYMSRLSETEIRAELASSASAIRSLTGKAVELFRPPYGDYDDLLINTSLAMGYYPIQWDVDSLDWKNLSASDITSRIVGKVKSGSIILMHNNGLHTAEALPLVIDALRANGYTFVPIGELIYRENYEIDVTGRQIPKGTA